MAYDTKTGNIILFDLSRRHIIFARNANNKCKKEAIKKEQP